ncbi:MAG: carboxypeptidase regulatory-like domain-containing protein [Planctomycetes bacterium]|nr:carboxypeptidase regulatory-like domain-containing protein [Planctomycetota bacterium]MCC7064938.1 carboxypeptidase regulatory-like domain-containing protein [Planctomycetota bacterium]
MDSPQPFLIHGMVEDVLGQPIADAWVGLHALERDEVLAESRTDAAGRFSMQVAASLMECDVGRLVAKAAGRAKGVAYANGHDNVQPIVRIVLPESCELRGRVTDEAGAPLAQVELIARHVGHLGDTVLACTDNEGRFVFDAVPIGRVLVTAWQRGRQLVHVEQDTCTDAPLELRLVPAHGRTIRFRILGASKQQWRRRRAGSRRSTRASPTAGVLANRTKTAPGSCPGCRTNGHSTASTCPFLACAASLVTRFARHTQRVVATSSSSRCTSRLRGRCVAGC